MPTVNYNLLDDDGALYLVQYMFTKLKTSPLSNNTTYTLTDDATNKKFVLTGSDGSRTEVSYQQVIIDTELSSTSTNPVQNKVINTALGNKVDKVSGKGLSTNDFTTALLNKLNGIAAGAEVNVQSDWSESDNTSDAFIKNKPTIPGASSTTPKMDGTASAGTETAWARGDHVHPKDTSKADLASPTFTGTPKAPTAAAGTNTTQIATTQFVGTAITNAIGSLELIKFQKVTTLPTTGTSNIIYLVPKSSTATQNIYDEYVWIDSKWELIGTTAIDLSGYVQYSDIHLLTNTEISDIVDDAYDTVWPSN